MKIQGTTAQATSVERAQRAKRGDSAQPARSSSSAGGATERTTVSDGARTLAAHAKSPERPDEARVARLKAEIERGSFRIDFDRIAEAMIREER